LEQLGGFQNGIHLFPGHHTGAFFFYHPVIISVNFLSLCFHNTTISDNTNSSHNIKVTAVAIEIRSWYSVAII